MKGDRPRDPYGRPLPRGSADEPNRYGDPADAGSSVDEALHRGVAAFDEQRFFEAHEFFESIWKSDEVEGRDREFWKGVTQVAVGCCHAQRENRRGALALLERGVGRLRRFPSPHRGIDTAELIIVARTVAGRVRRHGASAELDFPGFPAIG